MLAMSLTGVGSTGLQRHWTSTVNTGIKHGECLVVNMEGIKLCMSMNNYA